jgi:hypothetical protein
MIKKILVGIGLIAVSIIIFFIWPLSFTAVYRDTGEGSFMVIWITDVTIGDDFPIHETTGFQFETASTEFESIMQILRGYSYRQTLRGLTTTRYVWHFTQLEGNHADFWLEMRVFNADMAVHSDIRSGGTREIVINGIVYRMNSSQNVALMKEIRDFLMENVMPMLISEDNNIKIPHYK